MGVSHLCSYVCVCVHVCVYVHVYLYLCVCLFVCLWCVWTYVRMCLYIHMLVHVYSYLYLCKLTIVTKSFHGVFLAAAQSTGLDASKSQINNESGEVGKITKI